jgi:hypothetical protein
MKITGLGTDRLRPKLRIMSDEHLWWLFLHHREECSHEFWEEMENRKAAGTLSKDSPFWAMNKLVRYRHPRSSGDNSNLIQLSREEWEARRRRKWCDFGLMISGLARPKKMYRLRRHDAPRSQARSA